jgi:repressor LexA
MPPHQEQGEARRAQIMTFIREYMLESGYAPSMHEISAATGMSSANAARNHLTQLATKGYLSVMPGIARSIVLADPAPDGWTRTKS